MIDHSILAFILLTINMLKVENPIFIEKTKDLIK